MKNSKFNQLKRGFSKRCPKCGKSPIFLTYIKTLDYCKSCGIKFSNYKSDDGPAYCTIFLVGHFLIPLILIVEKNLVLQFLSNDFMATFNYNFLSLASSKS